MIIVHAPSRYKIAKKKVKEIVEKKCIDIGIDLSYDINCIFVGKISMKKYARLYKKEEVALPVLSFPYNEKVEGSHLLGEIIICYPQAVLLAAERGKKVEDILKWLIEHGLQNLVK